MRGAGREPGFASRAPGVNEGARTAPGFERWTNPALVFIKDWAPLVLLIAAYELMRDVAGMAGIRPNDLSGLDAFVPGGADATRALQAALYRPSSIGPLDVAATAIYFMHFVLPAGVGLVFWSRNRSRYQRFVAALLAACALAFLTYVVMPTTPPWLGRPDQVYKVIDETLLKLAVPSWLDGLYVHRDYNLYAAFPSLHAAFPLIATVYAWPRYRVLGVFLLAWTFAVWFSIVYLGEHYLVDIAAGAAYATAAVLTVEVWLRRRGTGVPPPIAGAETASSPEPLRRGEGRRTRRGTRY